MYPFGWTSRALASAKRWSGYVVPFPKWRREIMIKNGMSTVSHFSSPPSPFWPSWSWWVRWTLYLFHLFKNAFQHHDDYDNGQWRSWRSLPARIWRCYCCCCWRTLGGGERKPKRAKSGVGGGIVVVVGIVSRGPWRLPRVVTRVSKGYHMIESGTDEDISTTIVLAGYPMWSRRWWWERTAPLPNKWKLSCYGGGIGSRPRWHCSPEELLLRPDSVVWSGAVAVLFSGVRRGSGGSICQRVRMGARIREEAKGGDSRAMLVPRQFHPNRIEIRLQSALWW